MGENLPARRRARGGDALRVDGDDDALRAELLRGPAHDLTIGDRSRIDRGLVGAGEQEIADIVGRADAAANRQRHEAHLGCAPDHIEEDAAILVARCDVEKAQLVRTRLVVSDRALDRVPRVAQVDEIDALDDAAVLDVETGYDAGFESHCAKPASFGPPPSPFDRSSASAARGSSRPS